MRTHSVLPAALLLAALLAAAATVSAAAQQPVHYLVFELEPDGTPRLFSHTRVNLRAPLVSRRPEDVQRARRAARAGGRLLAVRLEDPSGRTLHEDVVRLPRVVRGEFHGEPREAGGWTIDAYQAPGETGAFVVRVPAGPGARVVLDGTRRWVFPLSGPGAPPPATPSEESVSAGNPANRVDLLIMGDGYTAAEQSDFLADAALVESQFFSITPYAEYANLVNVTPLYTASLESGADHPPYVSGCSSSSCCGDSAMQSDPLEGTIVSTAFDARYCVNHIHRLLTVSTGKVLTAASANPDWDHIIVLVNDATYGGSGGFLSVVSMHPSAVGVARHEYGHSFTDLADEYESPYPGYPSCSDVTASSCDANVTDETVRELIKWNPWIFAGTPIPTPETSGYGSVVGLFQGARYQSSGYYRPRLNCLMRSLGAGFCDVCRQEYVKTLYRGGWGTPSQGIDLIEPGSENPPTGPVVDGTGGVVLSAGLLQPAGGPPLGVTWLVDGAPQPGATSASFQFAPEGPGTYTVELEVEDVTTLVHPSLEEGLMVTSRSWTVDVAPGPDPGAPESPLLIEHHATPGDLLLSWGASCSGNADDYAIYEGDLEAGFASHTAIDCIDDGTPLSERITPSAGSRYYVLVPYNAANEGSYGADSSGTPRAPGASRCVPARMPAACP